MPIFSFIVPSIPADRKDAFLAAWPTIKADLEAQPGVIDVSAGLVVSEDGAPVTGFKFLQTLAFKKVEDFEAFTNSAWAKKHTEQYGELGAGDIVAGPFEVEDFPQGDKLPLTQFSTIVLDDATKSDEARKTWFDLVAAVGKDTWGGRSTGAGPTVGLALIGWNSLEEADAAYKKLQSDAAFTTYQSLGKTQTLIVQLQ
ncbi:hypothetical protein QQZ08_008548 [Neonectria magnoliae]|uniref:Stress-response A/B barrel domain-containing protein n=1 Tax=Neonectria magnoliae TaxID=2732573 RepID=A0ABR1HTY2_9HYPO